MSNRPGGGGGAGGYGINFMSLSNYDFKKKKITDFNKTRMVKVTVMA